MNNRYDILPEYNCVKRFGFISNRWMLAVANFGLWLSFAFAPLARGVRMRRLRSPDGPTVYLFEPKDRDGQRLPGVLFCHGGGFILRSSFIHKRTACDIAMEVGCRVFMPEYTLAQRKPYPAAADECFGVLAQMAADAEKFGVDAERLAVYGDSAGGNLAAAIALMCRDRRGPALKAQILNYPVTDDRMQTDSMKMFTDTPGWDAILNRYMWDIYLKNVNGDAPCYAAPGRATDLRALPFARVEVAEFDCLRDEGVEYARRLGEDGVEIDFVELKGAPHGYDMARNSPLTAANRAERLASLSAALFR